MYQDMFGRSIQIEQASKCIFDGKVLAGYTEFFQYFQHVSILTTVRNSYVRFCLSFYKNIFCLFLAELI